MTVRVDHRLSLSLKRMFSAPFFPLLIIHRVQRFSHNWVGLREALEIDFTTIEQISVCV